LSYIQVRQIALIAQSRFYPCAMPYGMTMTKIRDQLPNWHEEAKRRLIADIAYFAAERRGFSPGYELDD